MIVGEVVEINKAFKPDQTDELGYSLALGSIEVRIGGNISVLGQIRNVFARPAIFNRRIPLIGEQVLMMRVPLNNETTDGFKGRGYIYFMPLNTTDDLVLHQFPQLFTRDQPRHATDKAPRAHDRKEVGYTFPKSPNKTYNIQPFEGDDIWEGRFGQSIRMGSTVKGNMKYYDKPPTWKGDNNTDPLIVMRVKKPSGSSNQNVGKIGSDFKSLNKYTIEDIAEDDASIYITTTQMINSFKAGFNKNLDVKKAGNWKEGSQIIQTANRIIVNAKKDSLFLVGSKEVVVTGKRVLFQDEKYKVYLDELMDFLEEWLKQDKSLASGAKVYATACGPTSVATNMGDYIKLSTAEWTKFKKP